MSPAKKNTQSIESRLTELEAILEELESGDLELDQALKKFEQGVKLSRECQKTLEDAELKIKILMDNELKETNENLD
ncbi:MAG: exodeoxyribonuclease VII small subunit [Gammaproteobacteria bacterium]|jgi:exodeoxyribonuclease VII small subunit|nr:exodeoxyribonuclease VII small subunit [Gammaproteobacteria bacterium]|tara:strand:- start:1085 stop:1315 length:231 start_codon:yes stop_codon:yes gene_type:complete